MTDDLTDKQLAKINCFALDFSKAVCRNHQPPDEEVFGHFISIRYSDGTIEKMRELFPLPEIIKIFRRKDVEDIKINWTDVF